MIAHPNGSLPASMAIEAVKKVYLLCHKEAEGGVVGALQELGVVQPAELPLPGGVASSTSSPRAQTRELELAVERLDYLLDLLTRIAPPRGLLAGSEKILLTRREMAEVVAADDHHAIHERCRELERKLAELKNRKSRLETERVQVTPWLPLNMPFARIVSTAAVRIDAGNLPLARFTSLREKVAARGEDHALYEVNADGKNRYVVIISHAGAESLEEELGDHEFSPLEPPDPRLTPAEALEGIGRELEQAHAEEARLRDELKVLVASRPKLMALRDHYANLLVREKARDFLTRTEAAFVLTGWIPAREMEHVKKSLQERFDDVEVMFADPEDTETVPIILNNTPLARPFEVITDLYGRPVYRGVDPTPYIAPFFATFFGFCLTDAGYGIVVMLLAAFLLWWPGRRRPQGGAKMFYELFFLGGVATVLLGAMVGGWFGVTVEWKLFDALEDLFLFFGLALALGVLHLFTGLSIKMVRGMKGGDMIGPLYDQGLWMLIITALITWGLAKAKVIPASFQSPASVVSLGAALAIVFFHGRGADRNAARLAGGRGTAYQVLWLALTAALALRLTGRLVPQSGYLSLAAAGLILASGWRNLGSVLARIGLGLYSLYGISGFLGDTLSYSRLVALGLSTGIVAMIVNKMAGIALTAPYIGWIIALLVLIGGHAFNIAINLLGAFVHSCRLQYVEFFTKFYEGGGKPFRPLGYSYRHVIVKE